MTPTDTGLSVRPAVPDDADSLARLFQEARRAAEPAMPPSIHPPVEVAHWFGELVGVLTRSGAMPEGRETWVAELHGDLAGYLVLDPSWLDSLYVRPDLTGQGIGSVLLDLAKSLRPGGFSLWVFETNVGAQRFYGRHGLVPVRRTDGSDNEERAPDIEMAWWGAEPIAAVRRRIDDVDDRLARLLDERAALTAAAQRAKSTSGRAGRDPDREAAIVARMAELAPGLGTEALARIMQVVISESLVATTVDDPSPTVQED